MKYLRRFLSASPEAQAALLAILNGLNIFGVTELNEMQLGASNLMLVALMALTAKVAYGQSLAELDDVIVEARRGAEGSSPGS